MCASWFRLVIETHGRVPMITTFWWFLSVSLCMISVRICFQTQVHDWNYMSLLSNIVHLISIENILTTSYQRTPHRKNRSSSWARCSSTHTLLRKWMCLSRSLFIIASDFALSTSLIKCIVLFVFCSSRCSYQIFSFISLANSIVNTSWMSKVLWKR